jgi:hypothetical protein
VVACRCAAAHQPRMQQLQGTRAALRVSLTNSAQLCGSRRLSRHECRCFASIRSIGYRYGVLKTTTVGDSLPIWAQYVQCAGSEDQLSRCLAGGWSEVTSCADGTFAAVACSNSSLGAPPPPPSTYACEPVRWQCVQGMATVGVLPHQRRHMPPSD